MSSFPRNKRLKNQVITYSSNMMKALSFFFDTAINFLSIFSGPSCAQYMVVSIRGTKTFDMQQIKKIACLGIVYNQNVITTTKAEHLSIHTCKKMTFMWYNKLDSLQKVR